MKLQAPRASFLRRVRQLPIFLDALDHANPYCSEGTVLHVLSSTVFHNMDMALLSPQSLDDRHERPISLPNVRNNL